MADLILILGGIKTGKTRFAQERAAEYDKRGEPVVYLATAQAFDREMEDRIARHRADRPDHWLTVEEPLAVARAYGKHAPGKGVVLLDCLTLWLTNMMSSDITATLDDMGERGIKPEGEILPDKNRVWEEITAELNRLCQSAAEGEKDLIIVTNQVEYGLVSEYAFARMYQDLAGMAHQYLAARASEVYAMTAGIPVKIK